MLPIPPALQAQFEEHLKKKSIPVGLHAEITVFQERQGAFIDNSLRCEGISYDIRTIQELLGHSDVRTTMIYNHTIRSRALKEAKSPLDF